MAFEQRTMEQQLRDLQDQLHELSLAVQRRQDDDRSPRRYRSEDDDTDDSSHVGGHNRYGHRNRNTRSHNDIKVDIPEYDGRLDPDEFVEWLRTVERVFDYKETPDEKRVKIVALKLRKYASTWWFNVCSKRETQGKEKVRSWNKMKRLMKSKFMPSYYVQSNFSQLHALKQGTKTAEEYSRDFEHLIMKCDLDADDPQTLVRYLGGLESRIANIIELQPYSTLEELITLAHKVDLQLKAKGKFESYRPVTRSTPNSEPLTPPTLPTSYTTNPTDKSEPVATPYKPPRRCFRCHGMGHISSECPNKRVVTLTDFEGLAEPKYDEEPTLEGCHPGKEEIVLGPDEGDCLVVRRTLTGTVVDDATQQREAIFRTRCTVLNKVCSLVIDSGSCTNVASQVMISKLKLSTDPHPSPYDIQWLNQGKGIQVTKRVLLSFNIGDSYKEEVWCDVLPMDVCHILLGRPWMFDRKVVHDDYKNTYSFDKDGRKITLLPLTPSSINFAHRTLSTNFCVRSSKSSLKEIEDTVQVDIEGQTTSGGKAIIQKVFQHTQRPIHPKLHEFNPYKVVTQFGIDDDPPTLYPLTYIEDDTEISSLRTNFFEVGEDDRPTNWKLNEVVVWRYRVDPGPDGLVIWINMELSPHD